MNVDKSFIMEPETQISKWEAQLTTYTRMTQRFKT